MSIIRCSKCEKQIDLDFEEIEICPIDSKEYCVACYIDIMSKDFKQKHGSVLNFIDWLTDDYTPIKTD